MNNFMKKPCEQCPYRHDVKPFLHPRRGVELAFLAQNPYSSFHCHKTTVSCDDDSGENYAGSESKMCAGFLSLQHNENGRTFYDEDGFEPSPLAYGSSDDMMDAYDEEQP
jgi:hypothetical protein